MKKALSYVMIGVGASMATFWLVTSKAHELACLNKEKKKFMTKFKQMF